MILHRLKRAFYRYLRAKGYFKVSFASGSILQAPYFGFTNVGQARSQLEAYQGHVYKCVTVIYRRAISVPFKLYKQRGDVKEEVKRHPFLDLMKKPNTYMSGSILKAITFMERDLTGKAFWLIVLNRAGRPSELWPLPVGNFLRFKLYEDKNKIMGYEFTRDKGGTIVYPADHVIYFRYPHPTSLFDGASPIQSQAFAYDMDLAMRTYQRNFFQRGARPDLILRTDQEVSEEDAKRILIQWKEAHQGVERSWEPAILPNGLDAKILSMNINDLEFASLAKWTKEDILEAYNVPEGKLGTTIAGGDMGSVKAIDNVFNSECIAPRLRSYDEEINASLLPLYDDRLFMEHVNCIPRDLEFELKEREANLRTSTTTVNEERAKMGLREVPWGYVPWVSVTQAPWEGGQKS